MAARLTYSAVERGPMIERLLRCFTVDSNAKNVVVPDYFKTYYAATAKTADDQVAGRIFGYTAWNELHLDLLATNPDLKVPGTGTCLMMTMERIAREHGCDRLGLDTYSWQARPFYERLGFNCFGTEENFPRGHRHFFMEKVWAPGSAPPDPKEWSHYSLTITSSDPKETEAQLFDWLDEDTQRRKIPGVPHYVKKEYALQATLPDGTFAAGCVYETVWDSMHISYFAVNPDIKGKGIGSTVLGHVEKMAKDMGCYRMSLETMSFQAKPFYEARGFKEFGVQHSIPLTHSRHYLEKVF